MSTDWSGGCWKTMQKRLTLSELLLRAAESGVFIIATDENCQR